MKKNDTSKYFHVSFLWFAFFSLLAGVLLIALPIDTLLKVVFVIVGVITLVYHLPGMMIGLSSLDTRVGRISFALSLVSVVLGVLMIFFHSTVLMLILGAYLILIPLVQIIIANDRLAQFKAELPKLILGLVLLLIGPATVLEMLFDIAGWIIVALSIVYLLIAVLAYVKRQKQLAQTTGNRVFVDSTGDGKIDTVYMDTTGDGKPDVSTRYRDEQK